MSERRPIFDFRDPSQTMSLLGAWSSVDDRVMGGVSSSRAALSEDGLVFGGLLSLEHGGGFASIRTQPRDYGLAGVQTMVLRVLSDGRTYKLGLRTDDDFDGIQYQARFSTHAGTWEDVRLALPAFQPTRRGRTVPAPPLDPARIRVFGLLIADRQAGPFRLVVASLGAEGPAPADLPMA